MGGSVPKRRERRRQGVNIRKRERYISEGEEERMEGTLHDVGREEAHIRRREH